MKISMKSQKELKKAKPII